MKIKELKSQLHKKVEAIAENIYLKSKINCRKNITLSRLFRKQTYD